VQEEQIYTQSKLCEKATSMLLFPYHKNFNIY